MGLISLAVNNCEITLNRFPAFKNVFRCGSGGTRMPTNSGADLLPLAQIARIKLLKYFMSIGRVRTVNF